MASKNIRGFTRSCAIAANAALVTYGCLAMLQHGSPRPRQQALAVTGSRSSSATITDAVTDAVTHMCRLGSLLRGLMGFYVEVGQAKQ